MLPTLVQEVLHLRSDLLGPGMPDYYYNDKDPTRGRSRASAGILRHARCGRNDLCVAKLRGVHTGHP